METKIRHMRIPENLSEKIEKYQEENNISSFTQAVVILLTQKLKEMEGKKGNKK